MDDNMLDSLRKELIELSIQYPALQEIFNLNHEELRTLFFLCADDLRPLFLKNAGEPGYCFLPLRVHIVLNSSLGEYLASRLDDDEDTAMYCSSKQAPLPPRESLPLSPGDLVDLSMRVGRDNFDMDKD